MIKAIKNLVKKGEFWGAIVACMDYGYDFKAILHEMGVKSGSCGNTI